MMLLLAGPVFAASLAVLPLDARGVSGDEAAAATDTLRDALALERLEVSLATAAAAALAAGHEEALEQARTRYAEGRVLFSKGRAKEAVAALDEAARLHLGAGSGWARRSELADVAWSLAEARLSLGDTLLAREDLTALATFWPGYAATHPAVRGTAAKMLAEVDAGLARTAWAPPDDDTVLGLLSALGTDALVVGVIRADGDVHLLLYKLDGEAHTVDASVELPVNAAGLDWEELAGQLAGQLSAAPVAAAAPPERTGSTTIAPAAPRTTTKSASGGRDEPVRIKTGRAVRIEDGPITSRWWFWVGLVAVVGGGTSAAIAAAQPAPVLTVHESAEWSLIVTPP